MARVFQPLKYLVARFNYRRDAYRDVVWLIGDGRSGTSWLSGLINFDRRYRELFEPFHPGHVRDAKVMVPDQYLRKEAEDGDMLALATKVFSGRLSNSWVDRDNWRVNYSGLLVKDVLANLLAAWVRARFPRLRMVFLMRNPFAVALSKYHTRAWAWKTDSLDLLEQPHLFEDYLYRFEQLIRDTARTKDYFLNQVLRWSILNYIPLSELSAEDIQVVFYEEAYLDPLGELNRILAYMGNGERGYREEDGIAKRAGRPSRVTTKSRRDFGGLEQLNRWQSEVTLEQQRAGREILSAFGLSNVYGENGRPCRAVVERMLSGGPVYRE